MKMRSSPTSVGSPLCPPHLQSRGIGSVSRPSPSVGYPCSQGLPPASATRPQPPVLSLLNSEPASLPCPLPQSFLGTVSTVPSRNSWLPPRSSRSSPTWGQPSFALGNQPSPFLELPLILWPLSLTPMFTTLSPADILSEKVRRLLSVPFPSYSFWCTCGLSPRQSQCSCPSFLLSLHMLF